MARVDWLDTGTQAETNGRATWGDYGVLDETSGAASLTLVAATCAGTAAAFSPPAIVTFTLGAVAATGVVGALVPSIDVALAAATALGAVASFGPSDLVVDLAAVAAVAAVGEFAVRHTSTIPIPPVPPQTPGPGPTVVDPVHTLNWVWPLIRSTTYAGVLALGLAAPAIAQYPGQIPDQTVLGNTTGIPAPARPVAISSLAITFTTGCGLLTTSSLVTASGRRALTDADGDANLTATDNLDSLTDTLTASRFWFLPLAASLPAGCTIKIADEQGGVSATNQLNIATSGADLINGGAIYPLDGPYQAAYVTTDGVANWTVTANVLKAGCDAGGGTINTLAKFISDPYATCGDSQITNIEPHIVATPGADGHFIVTIPSASGDGGILLHSGNGLAGTDGGGNINLTIGNGADSGDGGTLNVLAGAGGGTSGVGGAVNLIAGGATNGNGGRAKLTAGDTVSGNAGAVLLDGGNSSDGSGGSVVIGAGSGTEGTGGNVLITAGGATAAAGAVPGAVSIRGGTPAASGTGGPGGGVDLIGANAEGGFAGGAVGLTAGNGGPSDGAGGTITLAAGIGDGSGNAGNVSVLAGATTTGSGGYIDVRATPTAGTQSATPGDANPIDGYISVAYGHIVTGKGTSSPATTGTISACGGGTPAFETTGENDTSGVITVGTGAVTACTLTFKRTFNAITFSGAYVKPKCFANNIGATPNAISISARSITAVTFTFAADINTTGGAFQYFCVQ